jgi:hypothetical protein
MCLDTSILASSNTNRREYIDEAAFMIFKLLLFVCPQRCNFE